MLKRLVDWLLDPRNEMDRIADTAGGLKGGCRCLQGQLKQSLSPFRRGF